MLTVEGQSRISAGLYSCAWRTLAAVGCWLPLRLTGFGVNLSFDVNSSGCAAPVDLSSFLAEFTFSII